MSGERNLKITLFWKGKSANIIFQTSIFLGFILWLGKSAWNLLWKVFRIASLGSGKMLRWNQILNGFFDPIRIQSPSQMVSKGCTFTSETKGIFFVPLPRWAGIPREGRTYRFATAGCSRKSSKTPNKNPKWWPNEICHRWKMKCSWNLLDHFLQTFGRSIFVSPFRLES